MEGRWRGNGAEVNTNDGCQLSKQEASFRHDSYCCVVTDNFSFCN